MALLGAQLVLTLIMVSIIQKVGMYFSFARWFLCSTGLLRYLYPTDSQLRTLANISKEKPKGKKGGKFEDKNGTDTFHVPRNLDFELETTKVSALDLVHLRFYAEYQWLFDFAIYSGIVYIFTEVYNHLFPNKDEVNLSMMWSFIALGFAMKILISLTILYFKNEESVGERSTCIVMGFTYLLISMMILIVDETVLEIGLEDAYSSFNKSASIFLTSQGLVSSGPASKIVLKFFLALWCGLMGALFTFPGLRVAKMHWDLLKLYGNKKIVQFLLNLSLTLPFILVTLWIKPVSRDYLTIRIFSGMTTPLLTSGVFESLRIILIIFSILLRLSLMPWYLQAYLNMARNRIEEQKKEAGRITNIELQKKIAAVFYYLCVVTLQYIAPLIICLFFTLMYKTLGGFSWNGIDECSVTESSAEFARYSEENIQSNVQQFHLALESIKSVFSEQVFRGLLGFATWWSCFTLFATTSVGLIYQSYFAYS